MSLLTPAHYLIMLFSSACPRFVKGQGIAGEKVADRDSNGPVLLESLEYRVPVILAATQQAANCAAFTTSRRNQRDHSAYEMASRQSHGYCLVKGN